ncbi:MAG: aldo/keto reductase [Fidelibacterota bacterium]
MKYRRLGNSGLTVSEISLGGWLTFGGHVDEKRSVRLIQYAFFNGVNLFDVADVYLEGRAEEVLGKALKEFPREQIVIATKVRGRMHPGPFGAGLSKKHILHACESSLRRLRTETIDLYQFHAPDEKVPLEESLEAMDILVRQGKVLHVGCSNFSASHIRKGLDISSRKGYPRFISNQPCYNMLERDIEMDVFPLCKAQGIGNIVYSPLAQGVLTGKYEKGKPVPEESRRRKRGSEFMNRYLSDANLDRVEKMKRVASDLGTFPAVLALAWILRRPEVSSAIVGATSLEQLDENLQAPLLTLTDDVTTRLEEILS